MVGDGCEGGYEARVVKAGDTLQPTSAQSHAGRNVVLSAMLSVPLLLPMIAWSPG